MKASMTKTLTKTTKTKRKPMTESMWVIVGYHGLYVGSWLLRRDAIAEHTAQKGKTWFQCEVDGDRAVKAVVAWSVPR
jgi:hypothetical protein